MMLNNFFIIPFISLLFVLLLIMQLIEKILKIDLKKIKIFIILTFSLLFVLIGSLKHLLVLLIISIITYIMNLIMIRTNDKIKKIVFIVSIIFLIISLAYFKYFNFFLNSLRSFIKLDIVSLNIILPLGISFYIFTLIGYTIDIYNGKYQLERNLFNYLLFVSFFPKLISGPIVKGDDFLPQINNYKGITLSKFTLGLQIFILGLFKKIVIADHLAVFVDDVFYAPSAFGFITVILGVISYSFQLYFDFSGYSDMAIGLSNMLGFDIKKNFNLPFLATNSSEFWSRWHISLSTWLKDYIYIPLGGNRKGIQRTYLNLFIVMLISGLWHGAGFTFIIWGILHGIYSCFCKLILSNNNDKYVFMKIITNFVVVTVLFVFFRAESISKAFEIFKSIFTFNKGINYVYSWLIFTLAILGLYLLYLCRINKNKKLNKFDNIYPLQDLSKIKGQIIFIIFVGITIIMGYYGDTSFIYGKF